MRFAWIIHLVGKTKSEWLEERDVRSEQINDLGTWNDTHTNHELQLIMYNIICMHILREAPTTHNAITQ